ncbi:MAG: Lrp/AsnC ligand binding domain-containing protein [Bacteroidaceae bacterium]|nr:Lrp/AsnC ligand binding domain-containing protein [Bacteroidaceae bacterium]
METIDMLDRKILDIITKNARIPFKDVAEVCGVSRAAIHQRVARLMDEGVITGSGYTVDPKALGYNTCTYVGIKLERASIYKEVAEQLRNFPEIVECHFTTGQYSIMVKLYSYDNEHLMELLNTCVLKIDGITSTEALISLGEGFSRNIPIMEPRPVKVLRSRPRRSARHDGHLYDGDLIG